MHLLQQLVVNLDHFFSTKKPRRLKLNYLSVLSDEGFNFCEETIISVPAICLMPSLLLFGNHSEAERVSACSLVKL